MQEVEIGKLVQGLSYEDYAAIDALRASDLQDLRWSPAHYRARKANPDAATEAQQDGLLIHKLFERGDQLLASLVVEPEFIGRTKDGRESKQSAEAKQMKAAWYSDLPRGTEVVTMDKLTMLQGISSALNKHSLVKNLVRDGVRETSLVVQDPETGVMLKCRPDLITAEGFLVDFKSTRDARPSFFMNEIFGFRGYFYVLSAAHYLHCLRVAGISKDESMTFVAIEKEPPYGIKVYPLDVGNIAPGEQWRSELTALYQRCTAENDWPGYPEQAVEVLTPEFVKLPGQENA